MTGFLQFIAYEVQHFYVLVVGQAGSAGWIFNVRDHVRPNEKMVLALPEFPFLIEKLDDGGSERPIGVVCLGRRPICKEGYQMEMAILASKERSW